MAGRKLTDKQARFVEEYLIDLNATQACIRAGYSARYADRKGSELLGKDRVSDAITKRIKDRQKRTEITQDRVLTELANIGFSDAGSYFEWGPDGVKVKPKEKLTAEQRAAVQEVSETVTKHGGTIRLKLADKIAALTKIGQHLGMFTERIVLYTPEQLAKMSDEDLLAVMKGENVSVDTSA